VGGGLALQQQPPQRRPRFGASASSSCDRPILGGNVSQSTRTWERDTVAGLAWAETCHRQPHIIRPSPAWRPYSLLQFRGHFSASMNSKSKQHQRDMDKIYIFFKKSSLCVVTHIFQTSTPVLHFLTSVALFLLVKKQF
jgi:hypothetical protein